MHYFVWLLIILLGVLIAGMVIAGVYLKTAGSNQELLDDITFKHVASSFSNGVQDGSVWTATPQSQEAILATVADLRTFLALAHWFRATPMPEPTVPMFFTLPEPAVSVKVFVASHIGITFPPGTDNLRGVLLSPTRVGFKFSLGTHETDRFFTGEDILPTLQELAVAIIYSTTL